MSGRAILLAGATFVLGSVLITADARAQNVQVPTGGNGVTVRTLPTPNTPRQPNQVQPQGLQTGSYSRPNTPLNLGQRPEQNIAVSGPYVGAKVIRNVP